MNYTIKKFIPETQEFCFEFDDKRWVSIDLANDFPNYHIIYNNFGNPFWYYISQDGENRIKKLNVLEIRKKSLKYKKTRIDNIVYTIANQCDYDNYSSENSENKKLYNMLKLLWDSNGDIAISVV